MGRIKNKTLYPDDPVPTVDDYLIGSDNENNGKTQNYRIGAIIDVIDENVNPSGRHTYRANLNKTNESNVTATVLEGGDLPEGVVIEYNASLGLGIYITVIKITGWDNEYIFMPEYRHESVSIDDDIVYSYRYEKAPSEVHLILEFKFEDFQILNNFPLEIVFYPVPA